jgi:hypothetical protein
MYEDIWENHIAWVGENPSSDKIKDDDGNSNIPVILHYILLLLGRVENV